MAVDIQPSSGPAILSDMIEGMRLAPPQTLPSNYWSELNRLNEQQLAWFGFESFKRTVARNYFTWVVSPRDDQIRFLIRSLPLHSTTWATIRTLLARSHPPMSWKHSLSYNWLSFLLWSYVRRQVDPSVLEMLEEPPEGNPPALYLRGRRISQDLGNAVLEFQSIARSGIDLSSTRTILELGAGYGRTAYVFQRLLPTARYIIADIPPALYLSQRYLSNQFSDRPILQYRPFTAFSEIETEFERARLCFLLPHQVELLPSKSVDLFINISSFHEMRPEQLRYYFHQVDRLAGGYVYLKQWKRTTIPFDEITLEQKDYPIPASWKPVFARECAVQTRFFEALYQAVR